MIIYITLTKTRVRRNSSVGIATRYGLEGAGIESRWRWIFPRGKAVGAWRWPPTPSSIEDEERIEI